MAQVSAWMPLYVGDYLADTMHLAVAEHGAYLLLIMQYWRIGPLPDDDGDLSRMAATEPEEWSRMAPRIRAFFRSKNGRLFHKRVDIERKRVENISKKRSKSGRSGAKARHRKPEENHDDASKCQIFASDLPAICHVQSQSQSQSKKESQKESQKESSLRDVRKPRQKPRSQINPDWHPSDQGVLYAKARGVLSTEVPRFINHHQGKGSLMASWDAAWRTWCDNAVKFGIATPLLSHVGSAMSGAL